MSKLLSPRIVDQTARMEVALHATYEIEALVGMMGREIEREADDSDLIVKMTARRVKELNSVVMSVLGDDDRRTTDSMVEVVYGVQPPMAEHAG